MKKTVLFVATVLIAVAVPGSELFAGGEPVDDCALCEFEFQGLLLVHRFHPEADKLYSEGTGFHGTWQENGGTGCWGGDHDHYDELCEGSGGEDFAMLERAVKEGDVIAVAAVMAANPRMEWNSSETAITGTTCDGTPMEVAVTWFGGDAVVRTVPSE